MCVFVHGEYGGVTEPTGQSEASRGGSGTYGLLWMWKMDNLTHGVHHHHHYHHRPRAVEEQSPRPEPDVVVFKMCSSRGVKRTFTI